MIFEIIRNIALQNPEKQAIVCREKSITCYELSNEIQKRAFHYQHLGKYVILSKSDTYENFIDFLSLISIQKICIFSSSSLQKEFLENLRLELNADILDDNSFFLNDDNFNKIEFSEAANEDIFLGVLTSGTTSTPIIIWKDYQSWFSAFPHQTEIFGINPNDRLFVLDALSYSANLNAALHQIWQGGTVVFASLASAKTWHQQIVDKQISSIFMVPSHYRLLVKNKSNLLNIKSLVSAGEKLDYKTAKTLIECCPNALLTEYYGAAELGHISYHQNQEILDYQYSVGKAFPKVTIEIKDQKIFVESPYISPDYRNVKTVLDLGYFEHERLVVLGRSGRMFNKRGLNIFAEEIENKALELEFIEEAAVVGKQKKDGSHDIFLVFSSKSQSNQSEIKDLKKYLLSSLPPAKQPKKILQIRNLPHTNSGKIDFQAINRLFPEEES